MATKIGYPIEFTNKKKFIFFKKLDGRSGISSIWSQKKKTTGYRA